MGDRIRVGVIGASGYSGMEMLRLLLRHPHVEVAAATSEQQAGRPVAEAVPGFRGLTDLAFEAVDPAALAPRIDLAMLGVPAATAPPIVAALRKAGSAVIDLSGAFRLRDRAEREAAYGPDAAPELMAEAVFGLPEYHREALAGAELVAAAGCYPTAALLPLLPFLRAGAVLPDRIHVDGKSGVSGAGRKVEAGFLLGELGENSRAYNVGGGHRHAPEMEEQATAVAGAPVRIAFVPQLLPLTRGLTTTVFATPSAQLDGRGATALLEAAYADEPFVRVLPHGACPEIAAVRGTNFCDVAAQVDARSGSLVLLSALDNLGKGAAGQMVQCLNLMRGYPETTGLLEAPLGP